MKRTTFCIAMLVVLFWNSEPYAQASRHGPEHKNLEYWLGTWTLASDVKASPFGPAGKMTGIDIVELGPGGFFLVFRNDSKTPAGNLKRIGIMGYDVQAKSYTWNGFDSMGTAESAKGTVQGSTWSWTTENKVTGKLVKGRFTANVTSPTSYTYKFEMQSDTGAWSTVEEGKATKSK